MATNLIRKIWEIRKINLEEHSTLTFLKYEILLPCCAAKMSPIFGIKTSLVQIRSLRTSIKQLLVVRRITWQFGDITKKVQILWYILNTCKRRRQTNKQTHIYIHKQTHRHIYIHIHIYTYAYTYYMYIYIYIYTIQDERKLN